MKNFYKLPTFSTFINMPQSTVFKMTLRIIYKTNNQNIDSEVIHVEEILIHSLFLYTVPL